MSTTNAILTTNANLPGVERLDALGLVLRKDVTREQVEALWAMLRAMEHGLQLIKTDLGQQTEFYFGAEFREEMQREYQLEIEFCGGLLAPPARRWENLTEEHYFVAAKECQDAAGQEVWLDAAEKAGLTASQLRASIRAGEIRACAPQAAGARFGMPMVQRVKMEFKLWRAAVTLEKMDRAALEVVRDELAEIAECHALVVGLLEGRAR